MTRDATPLTDRPGFLIRRLHQIHLALFAEECGAFGVTPVQYSLLTVLAAQPGLDQAGLGHEIGVDRATLTHVVRRLEARALLARSRDPADRRSKRVTLTERGATLLARMDEAAERAHRRTIEALPPERQAAFLNELRRLVEAGNDYGRAPLRLT